MPGSDEFTCLLCRQTFKKTWTDSDAAAEAEALWGITTSTPPALTGTLCGDCFVSLLADLRARPEQYDPVRERWEALGFKHPAP
jgi:hypothetical protein